ncbi:MAG: extracellular solute-binding protein [Oscillospiraceae bacterium]|nr:extracellular solute-binding protein [Oscillospiraceae bacterium]
MKKYALMPMLIIFAMIVVIMPACSSNNANVKSDNNSQSAANNSDVAGAGNTEALTDALPSDLNFNGAQINLFIQNDSWKQEEFVADTETGDVINDAVYRRNTAVEDRLNVKLNIILGPGWQSWDSMASQIRKSIMAGDQSYDLIAGWSARIPALALDDLFMNLYDLPYLDPSQTWWNQSMLTEMLLGGKLPFLCGDMTMSMISNCSVVYFNKSVQKDYSVPDLYQAVTDGKWTLDYMYSLTKDISKDLNGDGVMDDKDLYGIVLEPLNTADGFMQSSHIQMITDDSSGIPQLNIEQEKLSNLVDKVYSLYYENPGAYVMPDQSKFPDLLKNNQTLLMPGRLSDAIVLRDMESDYGIIPYPKYDETQDNYYSRIWDALSLMCVPMNCDKTEAVGAFMEAMGSESYKTVTPAYFNIALKDKYTRDDVSSQMLDIVRSGAYLNFASIYNESIGSPWFCMRNLMQAKSKDFASWYDKNESIIANKIDGIVSKING